MQYVISDNFIVNHRFVAIHKSHTLPLELMIIWWQLSNGSPLGCLGLRRSDWFWCQLFRWSEFCCGDNELILRLLLFIQRPLGPRRCLRRHRHCQSMLAITKKCKTKLNTESMYSIDVQEIHTNERIRMHFYRISTICCRFIVHVVPVHW